MKTAERELIELVLQLPPELQGEVRNFAEFLLHKQQNKEAQPVAASASRTLRQDWASALAPKEQGDRVRRTTHINDLPEYEDRLADLANAWRGERNEMKAAEIVAAYHRVAAEMIEQGWNGRGLSVDAYLPTKLMPKHVI